MLVTLSQKEIAAAIDVAGSNKAETVKKVVDALEVNEDGNLVLGSAVVEAEPEVAETKVGLALRVRDPPFPSVSVSTKLRSERVTLPVLEITIV